MESTSSTFLAVAAYCASLIVLIWGWRVLNWIWLKPRRLERCLTKQGLRGNSYRLLVGDLEEKSTLMKQAHLRPINPSDDIVPRVLPLIHRTILKYGKNSYIWFGPIPRVIVMEPALIKEIMTKHFQFQKPKTSPFLKLLATGVADYEGQQWAKHRKITNHAFYQEKLKLMVEAFFTSCSEMARKWENMITTAGATTNPKQVLGSCELDVWPHLSALSADVISRTAFGSNYEEGRRLFQIQREQGELVIEALESLYVPGSRFLPTNKNKKMKENNREIEALLSGIINKRVKAMETGEVVTDDLLGTLLESNLKEIQQNGNNKEGDGMSIQEVIEECKLFYLAGQETTSVLLVWTMVLLSKHQNWQQLARQEVSQVFGLHKPDFDGLNRLKIVPMILYEVLRLYPPVVFLLRTIHEDTQLGEMLLPAGVQLTIPTIEVHYDEELWGDSAKEFKPERFSEGLSKATNGQVSFFPFGWGPRVCIGQNFAMLEAKMALATILQRFSFELSQSYTHTPSIIVTLQPRHGAHLILHKL